MSAGATTNRKAVGLRTPGHGRRATARALAVLLHIVLCATARAGDDRFIWSYCAPPYPPACVESFAKTSVNSAISPRERLACDQTVERYVASVFAYRVCLSGETERAVREANRVLQIMKCPKDPRYCYDLPQPSAPPPRKPGGR